MSEPLHLFYAEPDPDRWLPLDRYPRRIIRRLVRGPTPPGGMMRYFLNLRAGLDRLGHPYTVNDWRRLRRTPGKLACVVGKHHLVERMPAGHPVLFGPAVPGHPREQPEVFAHPGLHTVVSCEWTARMFRAAGVAPVTVWAAGIDTDLWAPQAKVGGPPRRVLLYDKVRWERDALEPGLIEPVRRELERRGLEACSVRYGSYREEDYRALLGTVDAMVFLCEHETQGFAYLQALSAGVPLLAWDRGDWWRDPAHYPQHVRFGPVTCVPYWDARCGERFTDAASFPAALERLLEGVAHRRYDPRGYVVEHLDLAACARRYVDLARAAATGRPPAA